MTRRILSIGIVLFSLNAFSQSRVCDSTTMAKEGTFHVSKKFVATESASSSKEVFTGDILCIIEEKRHQTDTTTHVIGIYEIVIYPKELQEKK
jgi:hypothetical protein